MQKDSVIHEELFVGRDLALDYHDGGFPISIVTFEARNKYIDALDPSPFEGGYGRGIFAQLGLNEFLVKRSRNHWYQTEEIEQVIDIIKERAKGTTVITYGGSMGGMAAISFSTKLGAKTFIALSPLYDIAADGEVNDGRWGEEERLLDFKYNHIRSGQCQNAQGYVFYCPDTIDVEHALGIERMTRGTLVPLEFGGHPVSFFLNDTYKLKRLVSEIANDEFDLAHFHRVVRSNTPLTHYPYEKQALELSRSGDLLGAIDAMQTAELKNTKIARLPYRLGNLLLKAGKLEEAKLAFQRAVDIEPSLINAHSRLSRIHEKQGRLSDAIRSIRRAVKFAPSKADVHLRLGELLLTAGRPEEAEASITRSLKINAIQPKAHVRLSYAYADQNRWSEAANEMIHAVALEPTKSEYYLRLGEWQLKAEDYHHAEISMQRAVDLAPENSHGHVRLSYAFAAQKNYTQAVIAMNQACRLSSDKSALHLRLGECLIKAGDLLGAEKAMRDAVRLNPASMRAHKRLDAVISIIGRHKSAFGPL